MEPATPDEIDAIIAELMADPGPPLLVTYSNGRTVQAGTRKVSYGSYAAARDRERERRRKLDQLEQIMRDRGWEQDEAGVWRTIPAR